VRRDQSRCLGAVTTLTICLSSAMTAANDNNQPCKKCGEVRSAAEFYANRRVCKQCVRTAVRSNYAANRNYYVEYERQREQTDVRRAFKDRARIKYRIDNPEKYRARYALRNAVRDGKLVKQPCATCGSTERIHAHHHDYSKPLDVEWLCKDCHWARHNAQRKTG
jgi:hypothetical protein